MGLFDFFKRKDNTGDKNEPEKPPIEPNEQGEFNLQLADFTEKVHRSKLLADVWVNPDFKPKFKSVAKWEPKPPGKKGDIIELKWYAVKIILWGQTVELRFDLDTVSKSVDDFVQKINQQLNWLTKSKDLIDEVIIRDLLQLKNDNWLDENQPPLNKEDFLKSIRPTSISFIRHAAFDLQYDDGDLFWGHSIEVKVSSKREVKKASMEG